MSGLSCRNDYRKVRDHRSASGVITPEFAMVESREAITGLGLCL